MIPSESTSRHRELAQVPVELLACEEHIAHVLDGARVPLERLVKLDASDEHEPHALYGARLPLEWLVERESRDDHTGTRGHAAPDPYPSPPPSRAAPDPSRTPREAPRTRGPSSP